MAIVDQVESDMKSALRAGDRERTSALRLLLAELRKAHKEGDGDELAVLRRERKRRADAAAAYRAAGRSDLAEREEGEAQLLAAYLPSELSDGELAELVREAIAATGAASPADMGRVMKHAVAAAQGRAEGSRLAAAVRAALQG
ncbi:MAG TPA: GatB/YqeY domain-containing protein [Solirubrobacteraceae bacterium]|nr:GatB/YqeY domain-containing protein [Solirubrobacteraceae bacterium]